MTISPNNQFLNLGTESAFGLLSQIEALRQQGHDIINLGIGQPDFHPPQFVQEAGIKAIRDGHHGYTHSKGIMVLREAVIADLIKRHGSSPMLNRLSPDRIMIVPGGKVTMFQAITMLGGKGREIIYPDPGFPIYKSLIDYSGAKAVPLSLSAKNDYAPTADDLAKLINPNTALVILNSPSNPLGSVIKPKEVQKIASLIAQYPNATLLSDEIYDGLVFEANGFKSFLTCPEIEDQLIVLDGWSKRYAMTGWRLGMAVWPKSLMDYAERLAMNSFSCVNAPAQYAALAALEGDQSSVKLMCEAFKERADYFVGRLNEIKGIRCMMPNGAFYAFANIEKTGLNASEFQKLLLEKAGVGALAGQGFGAMGHGHIRFSFAASMPLLTEASNRIEKICQELI